MSEITPVCMMSIGRSLFIEFGNTANALYAYNRPQNSLQEWELSSALLRLQENGIKAAHEWYSFKKRSPYAWPVAVKRA